MNHPRVVRMQQLSTTQGIHDSQESEVTYGFSAIPETNDIEIVLPIKTSQKGWVRKVSSCIKTALAYYNSY